MAAHPHQPGSHPTPAGTLQYPSEWQQPLLAGCLPPASSPLQQQAPAEDSRAFSPPTWCMKAAGLALLRCKAFTACAGSAHLAHTQQARRYRGWALPYGLSSAQGSAPQPVRPRHRGRTRKQQVKYLTEFLVHVKGGWMLPRLHRACCHLAVAQLCRGQRGLGAEPELNLCIHHFLHIFHQLR